MQPVIILDQRRRQRPMISIPLIVFGVFTRAGEDSLIHLVQVSHLWWVGGCWMLTSSPNLQYCSFSKNRLNTFTGTLLNWDQWNFFAGSMKNCPLWNLFLFVHNKVPISGCSIELLHLTFQITISSQHCQHCQINITISSLCRGFVNWLLSTLAVIALNFSFQTAVL